MNPRLDSTAITCLEVEVSCLEVAVVVVAVALDGSLETGFAPGIHNITYVLLLFNFVSDLLRKKDDKSARGKIQVLMLDPVCLTG